MSVRFIIGRGMPPRELRNERAILDPTDPWSGTNYRTISAMVLHEHWEFFDLLGWWESRDAWRATFRIDQSDLVLVESALLRVTAANPTIVPGFPTEEEGRRLPRPHISSLLARMQWVVRWMRYALAADIASIKAFE